MCLQSCTFVENPRSTRCNQFIILFWWTSVTVVAGHEGFCSRYNNNWYMLLAFTRATTSHQELGHRTQWQLSWSTAVTCFLKAYFSVWITSFWHYLLPLCSKATCNVSITFCCLIIYAAKIFFVFIIFMVDLNHACTKYFNCEQFSNCSTLNYQSSSLLPIA